MNTEKEDGSVATDQSDCVSAAEPGDDTGPGPFEHVLSAEILALAAAGPERLLNMTWEQRHGELVMVTAEMRRIHKMQINMAAMALELAIEHPGEPKLREFLAKLKEFAK